MATKINVPNSLSAFRIIAFPFLMYLAWKHRETAFIILIFVSLFSDLIDGAIARKWNIESKLGAKLDSYGDFLTMIAALYAVFVMKWQTLAVYKTVLFIFLATYVLFHLFALFKYRALPSFHLYSWKITAILLGLYFFVLFFYGIEPISFYVVMIIAIFANIEETILLFIIPRPTPNLKGLYWVLKERKHSRETFQTGTNNR